MLPIPCARDPSCACQFTPEETPHQDVDEIDERQSSGALLAESERIHGNPFFTRNKSRSTKTSSVIEAFVAPFCRLQVPTRCQKTPVMALAAGRRAVVYTY